jgi:hypothetical protein
MITGLCRCLKNFQIGDRYIYVTRLCPKAMRLRKLSDSSGPRYFGVASMIVTGVRASHEEASLDFQPRKYVVAPSKTPYPPGLAHASRPIAAVARESCIVHTTAGRCGSSSSHQVALTPDSATHEHWQKEYEAYHERQAARQLGAAFCEIETVAGREALATNFDAAPVCSREDWENRQLNVNGHVIREETGNALARRIADGGAPA